MVLACKVLGPTVVEVDGHPVPLGGPLPRRLVTALIAAGGAPVDHHRLAEAMWGDDAPTRLTSILQVYISRLRTGLGDPAREHLVRTAAGYQLTLPDRSTDVQAFDIAVPRGRLLLAGGDPWAALTEIDGALGLWRGSPYTDLDGATGMEAERGRLGELREVALETRVAAQLATGNAMGAAAELDAMVAETPYRETRWALLALALYRSGRQGDALLTLRRARGVLADDLGVDPGPELQQLERRVLMQDPQLLQLDPGRSAVLEGGAPPTVVPSTLVRPLTACIGRGPELDVLAEELQQHRLVTLVGPAGVGKTRLALEHVHTLDEPDGPWLVGLADLRDGAVLMGTIAAAMGISAADPASRLMSIGTRSGTLVLDNCEHMIADVAPVVIQLLGSCPELRVLATSRELLQVDGEAVVPVAPLPVRRPDGSPGPAIELLVGRVRAARGGWEPDAHDLRRAEQLCTALDGLPLAIELAAARTRMFGLGEIMDRLAARSLNLEQVARGSISPHRSLQGAIEWSLDLLAPADRLFLQQLWPFDGGFSLEAAEAVAPASPASVDAASVESLSSLVTKSLVSADTTTNPARYRMLETVRDHCRDHDRAAAERRSAHARWVRELVAASTEQLGIPRPGDVVRRLGREIPNIRAGIRHDLEHAPELALRTIGQLDWLWIRSGHFEEADRLLAAAFAAAPEAPALDKARALMVRGDIVSFGGAGIAAAEPHYLDAIRIAASQESADHRALTCRACYQCAFGYVAIGDAERSAHYGRRALELAGTLDRPWLLVNARVAHGASLVLLDDLDEGCRELTEAIELARRHDLPWSAGWAQVYLGQARMRGGAAATAEVLALLRPALARSVLMDDISFALIALAAIVAAVDRSGDHNAGAALWQAAQRHCVRHGIGADTVWRAATSLTGGTRRPPVPSTSREPLTWEAARAMVDTLELS